MKTNSKKFVVVAVDRNDSSDEVPRKLEQFDSRDEAAEFVREDMRGYCDKFTYVDETGTTHGPRTYDEDKFYIESSDGEASCQWAIIEVDV